jgi:hypothetical protein
MQAIRTVSSHKIVLKRRHNTVISRALLSSRVVHTGVLGPTGHCSKFQNRLALQSCIRMLASDEGGLATAMFEALSLKNYIEY